ncbi:DNase I-like protein [Rickenella mellea]|uniref:DNase I-like protein n=1 Tax=Rickenella mellea TaxID=50990 RepID=A0A4Y7QK97_9AGAM|nr:DNase I-like protein [Rickenella mellea]
MSESQIRVLTLNCWGLKYVSKNRRKRIQAITNELARAAYDIVALQELWVFADYELVRNSVPQLSYSKFFYSGALGSGLALFSRFPIIDATIHPYSLNGSPIDVAAGDWFVGKAAARVLIEHPVLGLVEVFNTHLFAKGGEDGPEHNRAHRLVNAWEFAKLARTAADKGRYVIAMGDFNSIPTSLPMSVIREHSGLTDVWTVVHGELPHTSVNQISPTSAIQTFGVTADSPINTFSAGKSLDPTARKHLGKRLDYILFRQPTNFDMTHPYLNGTHAQVVLTTKVPGHHFSYSDHFALEATFEIKTPSPDHQRVVSTHVSEDSIRVVLQALGECYRISKSRSRMQLATFATCIAALIALTISSAWLPHSWLSSLFMLVTIIISWSATTLFYVGFLFGNWESRALMNIIEELEILQNYQRRRTGVSIEEMDT